VPPQPHICVRGERNCRRVVAVKLDAAWAAHHRSRDLRRHLFATLLHGIFPRVPVPSIAPFLEVGFCAVGQKHYPCRFKPGAGLIERSGGAAGMLARMAAGTEAADPFPWRLPRRDTYTTRDRAAMDIAVIDVPAVVAFRIPAAGECGHRERMQPRTKIGKPLQLANESREPL
jgi:hypothetical protein